MNRDKCQEERDDLRQAIYAQINKVAEQKLIHRMEYRKKNILGWADVSEYDKEIERLRGLLAETATMDCHTVIAELSQLGISFAKYGDSRLEKRLKAKEKRNKDYFLRLLISLFKYPVDKIFKHLGMSQIMGWPSGAATFFLELGYDLFIGRHLKNHKVFNHFFRTFAVSALTFIGLAWRFSSPYGAAVALLYALSSTLLWAFWRKGEKVMGRKTKWFE